MSRQTIQTWRQVVFATIVLAFIGATVGTAFGMVRTKSDADDRHASEHAPQPAVSPSVTPSSAGQAEQVANQSSGGPTTDAGNATGQNTNQNQNQNENRCKVPNVIGYHEADARKKLTDCGLKIGEVRYGCDEQAEAGKVTWQSPDGGNMADRGSKASLLVQGVKVPSVIGQYWADAKASLEHLGFKVTVNNPQSGSSGGSVSAQNPSSGCLKAGSTITITVGTTTTTSTSPSAPAGA